MRYCENCGNPLGEGARCCGRCGKPVPGADPEPRDYWAQRLQKQKSLDDDLPKDLNGEMPEDLDLPEQPRDPGEPRWITMVEPADPCRKGRWIWALAAFLALVLLGAGIFLGLRWFRAERVPCRQYLGRLCMQGDLTCPGDGDWVKLYEDGRASLSLLGTEETGTWARQDSHILITLPDRILEGREEAGCLLLMWEDLQFLLAREGVTDMPELTVPAPEPEYGLWSGDCYGWWTVTEAWGSWEENAGLRFDVCGSFRMVEENRGMLELWDTECGPDELFCAADFTVEPGLTAAGCFRTGTGMFCGVPMEPGTWNVDPGRRAYEKLEAMTIFSGSCRRGDSGFSYLVYLRPWGMDWEDVKKLPSGLLPEKNRLPESYGDWYLPKIAAGDPMPEAFSLPEADNWK